MAELKLLNSLVDNRYEVLERKGIGSYSEIFVARDRAAAQSAESTDLVPQQSDLVIIKALNTQLQGTLEAELEQLLIDNFRNEAAVLGQLDHANIIRLLDEGSAIDLNGLKFNYLTLEYLPGGDLLQRCKESPLSLSEMIDYLRQICDALDYAHAQNIIHRDIKPNNLLISADGGTVKIADFGIAKINCNTSDNVTRVGSNSYAPPEHHPSRKTNTSETSLTPSADIYSLAKTVYTLISGHAPYKFEGRSISDLPERLNREPWAGGLLLVLSRATSAEISARFSSAREFYQAIETVWQESEEVTHIRPSATRLAKVATPSQPLSRDLNEAKIVVPLTDNSPVVAESHSKRYLGLLALALILTVSLLTYSYYRPATPGERRSVETEAEPQPTTSERLPARLPATTSANSSSKDLIRAKQDLKPVSGETAPPTTLRTKPPLQNSTLTTAKERALDVTPAVKPDVKPVTPVAEKSPTQPTPVEKTAQPVAIPTSQPKVSPKDIPADSAVPLPNVAPEHLPPAPTPKAHRELPKVPTNADEPLPDREKEPEKTEPDSPQK